MEFDSVVKKRCSVRNFKNKKVSWKDVLEAIDAALQGPFAGNHNNLKFLIIEEKERIKEVSSFCEQSWIEDASLLVLVCSDDMHLENTYGERGRIYSRQQAGAAIVTLMFKLVDSGLSSCWVGAYSDELIKSKLKIPQHVQIEAIISVGYSTVKPEKKEKKALEHALYWDRWGNYKRPTIFRESTTDTSLARS